MKGTKLFSNKKATRICSAALLLTMTPGAYALKASDLGLGWMEELGILAPIILAGFALAGIITAASAVISSIYAKKNQQPLSWQLWGAFGGAVCVVIPVLILAFAGSFSDEQGNAEGVMSELNIDY